MNQDASNKQQRQDPGPQTLEREGAGTRDGKHCRERVARRSSQTRSEDGGAERAGRGQARKEREPGRQQGCRPHRPALWRPEHSGMATVSIPVPRKASGHRSECDTGLPAGDPGGRRGTGTNHSHLEGPRARGPDPHYRRHHLRQTWKESSEVQRDAHRVRLSLPGGLPDAGAWEPTPAPNRWAPGPQGKRTPTAWVP